MSGPLNKLQNILGNIAGRRNSASPKDIADQEHRARSLLHPTGRSTIQLSPSRVRIVVFKDDMGVKQPLFDSQQVNCETEGEEPSTKSLCDMRSIERLENSSSSTSSVPPLSTSSGWVGSCKNRRAGFVKRPSTDSELLGEMMFGSMPMKTIGNSVKVHYIRSTDQLMLTKTFSCGRKILHQCSLTDYSNSCPLPGDASSQTIERAYVPVPKNHSMINSLRCSISPDSGRNLRSSSLSVPILRPSSALSTHSSPATHSPPSPIQSLSVTGSVSSSLTRRIQRYRATSLEDPAELYRKVLKPLDRPPHSKKKYGIGVILSLSELSEPDIQHFQSFLFSHFTLIDTHLEKLKSFVLEAPQSRGPAFVKSMTQAYEDFLRDFIALYKAPRIESPVWLSLVGQVSRRDQVCKQFMEEFGSCIIEMETKEKKFFLSSLLTAVLSHHLAWVFTESRHSTTDSRLNKMIPKSFGVLAESHPYNPLWAQLGDLFGAVSYPLKLTRTIVTGKNSATVNRLLYILTYFIRCSEVEPWKPPENLHHKPSQRIPVPNGKGYVSSNEHQHKSNDSSHSEMINKLDDDYLLESRASSITVMADHETHSLRSPFASPTNFGRETPLIKPHPFSIRQSSRQHSFNSDVDPLGSLGSKSLGASFARSPKSPRKSGSMSSRTSEQSDSRHSSLKHTFPVQPSSPVATAARATCNDQTNDYRVSSPSNTHYPNAPADIASCQSMGLCPEPDSFMTFDPKASYRAHQMSPSFIKRSPQNTFHGQDMSAQKVPHSRMSQPRNQQYTLHKNNSTTSMDSGYDRSLTASSTTEYSRDSYTTTTSGFSDSSKDSCNRSGLFFSRCDGVKEYSMDESKAESCDSTVQTISRPRSDAISFSCRREATNYRICKMPPIEHSDDNSLHQSPDNIQNSISPDLPSPTQPLLPTKVSRLIQNDQDYTSVIRKINGSQSNFESQRVPLLQVQQPTLIKEDSEDDSITAQGNEQSSPGRSLRRQAALLSDSDSPNPPPFQSSTYDTTDQFRPFSPSQSLPLSAIPFMSMSRTRSSSDQDAARAQSPSMLSTDSGRGTKSGFTGNNSQQDLENLSQTSDLFDSDDAFCELPSLSCSEQGYGLLKEDSFGDDPLNVEKSFSPNTLKMFRQSPSLLQQQLQAHDRLLSGDGQPLTPEQFSDFEDVVLPSVDEFHLEDFDQDQDAQRQNLDDFGHSLFVGLSPTYLSDFVLHGTTQPADQHLQDKIFKDLRSAVKYSIIDEPIEHGVAIVADTDSWTVRILSTSRCLQTTSDVIMGSTFMQPSRYIKQLLSTIKSMNEMRLPAEFCLSHVEDRLLELNERSITLANTLLEYGSDTDFAEILPRSLDSLGMQDHYDRLMLIVLAGVNCPDQDIKARLDYIFMTNLLGKQYF